MEGIQLFIDFNDIVDEDSRIGTTHISLYMALLAEYLRNSYQLPITIDRKRILTEAKICRKTYGKCMKELQEYGYISYKPSSDPYRKSQVFLKKL